MTPPTDPTPTDAMPTDAMPTDSTATDPRPDFGPSADALAAVVAGVRDDQLANPTPSAAYTVGDLLDHVDGLARGLQRTAAKRPDEEMRDGTAALIAPGWRTRIPAELHAMAAAWADPAAWVGDTVQGGVPLPAAESGMFALDELVVHGWELARATAQPYRPDPAAVDAVWAFLRGYDLVVADGLFGPPVPVPDDAPTLDRLLGRTGRDPAWAPPAR